MLSATHVIMTVRPALLLLPILGLLVLPCAPTHLDKEFRVVANVTVDDPANCSTELQCPVNESCTKAIVQEKHQCFLITCPNELNNSCENVTDFHNLLSGSEPVNNNNSFGTNSSQSSPESSSTDITQTSKPKVNISTLTISTTTANSLNISTTILHQTLTENATTTVPKPATNTTIPSLPMTSTIKTTSKPTTASPTPSPTTTTSTTVTQIINQPSSSSPLGNDSSASISPSVPTTPPAIPPTKPFQNSSSSTSSVEKPSPTTPKTSKSPSVAAPTLPKAVPKEDQAVIEVAGDPLTSHLLNTSSLLAVLLFGLLFFVFSVAMFLKQAYESYRRKDYTQVDYLINGMYSDSGV